MFLLISSDVGWWNQGLNKTVFGGRDHAVLSSGFGCSIQRLYVLGHVSSIPSFLLLALLPLSFYRFASSLYMELALLAPLGLFSGLVNTLVTTRVTKEVHHTLMGPTSAEILNMPFFRLHLSLHLVDRQRAWCLKCASIVCSNHSASNRGISH